MGYHEATRRDRGTPHPGAAMDSGEYVAPSRRERVVCCEVCGRNLHRSDSRRLRRCTVHVVLCRRCGVAPKRRLVRGLCEQCYSYDYRLERNRKRKARLRTRTATATALTTKGTKDTKNGEKRELITEN